MRKIQGMENIDSVKKYFLLIAKVPIKNGEIFHFFVSGQKCVEDNPPRPGFRMTSVKSFIGLNYEILKKISKTGENNF